MQLATKNKISELQAIMTKMSLGVCCMTALPEFRLSWREVSRVVQDARLPMTSASVAWVICRHVAKSLPAEDVDDIVARLRLKLVATQVRTWHLIRLSDRDGEEPPALLVSSMPSRIHQALKSGRNRISQPEIETVMMGDFVYMSVRLVSKFRKGAVLYAAAPLGLDAALVSALTPSTLIRAAVAGLGYKEYEDANLNGPDIESLLRINNRALNVNADHLANLPEYLPRPTLTKNGIDYTNKAYNEKYVDEIIGPDPPLLTNLNITTTKSFFDPSRLDRQIKLTINLKSDDVAKSLKAWVSKGALPPTSDFFQIYHKIKCNKITYSTED